MAKVYAYVNKDTNERESLDDMLKRFKKQVKADNILYECKKREFFVKKSIARKLKSIEARKRSKGKKRR